MGGGVAMGRGSRSDICTDGYCDVNVVEEGY